LPHAFKTSVVTFKFLFTFFGGWTKDQLSIILGEDSIRSKYWFRQNGFFCFPLWRW